MSTLAWVVVGIVSAMVGLPLLAVTIDVIAETDWIKLFGGPSRKQRESTRRMAEAHREIAQAFADAAVKMTNAVNPFRLGGWK